MQSDREKNELTYALQNSEHPGRTWGKGVVPWKYGFGDYIDTYRSRDRRKNEERQHLRRLEEQLLSQDERMTDEVRRQVALAMSQQQQQQTEPAEPIVDAAGLSQRKSSCASTGLPANTGIAAIDTTAEQHFPMDGITQRTPCALQTCSKNLRFTVAYSSAMPSTLDEVYHGQEIPAGYAKVGVEEVCNN